MRGGAASETDDGSRVVVHIKQAEMYCHSTETGVSRQTDTLNGGDGNARHDLQIGCTGRLASIVFFFFFLRAWIIRLFSGFKRANVVIR